MRISNPESVVRQADLSSRTQVQPGCSLPIKSSEKSASAAVNRSGHSVITAIPSTWNKRDMPYGCRAIGLGQGVLTTLEFEVWRELERFLRFLIPAAFRNSDTIEVCGKIIQLPLHFRSPHGQAVPTCDNVRFQCCQLSHRAARTLPIWCEIHRWPMHR